MLRVLISAYACEPHRGSEPGVGWNWVTHLARHHKIWVITRANNRQVIEREIAKAPLANVRWLYYDLPAWLSFWKKGPRGVRLYYHLWQIGIYFLARKLHREVEWQLVHHVTFVRYWSPSFLALLPVPFVWGPVGGGEFAPRTFWGDFSLRGKIYEMSRNLAQWLAQKNPFVKFTARQSVIALATTKDTARELVNLQAKNVRVFSQLGLSPTEMALLSSHPNVADNSLCFISIGRLLHLKGFHLAIRAFARFHREFPDSIYYIIGDGPERKRLEKLTRKMGIGERTKFCGQLPREHVFDILHKCNVLLHPSLHDSGGGVCLEAMAAGKPVICLNLGGPALQVTPETGFKIDALTPQQVTTDMVRAMLQFAHNPELMQTMGLTARRRISEHFLWENKALWMAELYQTLLSRQEDRSSHFLNSNNMS